MTLAQLLIGIAGVVITVLINVAVLAFFLGQRDAAITKNAADVNGVGQKVRTLTAQMDAHRWDVTRALLEVAPEKAEKVFRIFMESKR